MTSNNHNLYLRFAALCSSHQRPFIHLPDGSLITYAQADARSAQLAHALTQLGVQPGDRVLVQVDKSAEALLLYLACLRCGAVYVPLNTGYTLAELEYFMGDAEPALVVCSLERESAVREMVGTLRPTAASQVMTLDATGHGSLSDVATQQPSDFGTVPRASHNLAAILYTSGTTGRSKGAMLSHDNLGSNCFTLKDAWRYTTDDVLLHALPIFHTHGLFVATNITLASGASMILLPKFEAALVKEHLPQATVMMGVPTFYTRLLQEHWLDHGSTRHLRLFISGSAPLLADTHREWQTRTGHAILERYGMTETNMNTSNPYDGARVPGTVGLPLPGVSLRIVHPEQGHELARNEIGMIEVQGPNVFGGYWRLPEKTRAEFREGWFITGDLGKVDEQGYVHIVGRGKDLVISGGFNVYPKEVETELDALPGVIESAVFGVAHPDFGEGVTAAVVRDGSGRCPDEAAVIAALKQRLAAFKVPKRVLFMDDLPRNTMGKVQKNLLREQWRDLYS